MSSEHTISIATADRTGAHGGGPVSVPAEELLTSNGLVTGQSGAEPTASVRRICESLLDAGETLLVVDPAGEFDALAEHASVLHVGGSRDCDVRVGPSAVDRVASLALEGSTSIVLDLGSFDASGADDLLGSLTDDLVDADGGRDAEHLLVVHECHRWLAASGPATRTGENLVQLGSRRHDGVGIVGITDQPADIRDDVLSGVDWVLAHRLTWQEDVRALEGMFDRQTVDALDTLGDQEAVFAAGWERGTHRLDFARDPSSTNSASDDSNGGNGVDDLFADLPEARTPEESANEPEAERGTPGAPEREDESVRDELSALENRIASLEAKLDARRDLEGLVDGLADAITEGIENAEITLEQERSQRTEDSRSHATESTRSPTTNGDEAAGNARSDPASESDDSGTNDSRTNDSGGAAGGFGDVFDAFGDSGPNADDEESQAGSTASTPTDSNTADSSSPASQDYGTTTNASAGTGGDSSSGSASSAPSSSSRENGSDSGGMSFEPIDFSFEESGADVDSTVPEDFGSPSRRGSSGRTIPRYLRNIVRGIEEMDVTTRRMLAFYIEEGTESPMDAHFSAGGGGDRTRAYAHNRQLRTNGLIEHVGKGKYAPRLREYIVDEAGHSVPDHELDRAVDVIRQAVDAA